MYACHAHLDGKYGVRTIHSSPPSGDQVDCKHKASLIFLNLFWIFSFARPLTFILSHQPDKGSSGVSPHLFFVLQCQAVLLANPIMVHIHTQHSTAHSCTHTPQHATHPPRIRITHNPQHHPRKRRRGRVTKRSGVLILIRLRPWFRQ